MFINKLGFISFTENIVNLEEITYDFQLKKEELTIFLVPKISPTYQNVILVMENQKK